MRPINTSPHALGSGYKLTPFKQLGHSASNVGRFNSERADLVENLSAASSDLEPLVSASVLQGGASLHEDVELFVSLLSEVVHLLLETAAQVFKAVSPLCKAVVNLRRQSRVRAGQPGRDVLSD